MDSRRLTYLPSPVLTRKLHHRLARRHLLAGLVLHHHVDQHPTRTLRDLLRFDDSGGLNDIAGLHRLHPPRFQPAVDRARRIGPVGDHPGNQPEIVHAVHDDAAEIGLAEIALLAC